MKLSDEMKKWVFMHTIPQGTLLLFSTGEYSNYSVYGLYKVLKSFTPSVALEEYFTTYPEALTTNHWGDVRYKARKFVKWLVGKEVLTQWPYREAYLGDYGAVVFRLVDSKDSEE